jgi:hypothetical protein
MIIVHGREYLHWKPIMENDNYELYELASFPFMCKKYAIKSKLGCPTCGWDKCTECPPMQWVRVNSFYAKSEKDALMSIDNKTVSFII